MPYKRLYERWPDYAEVFRFVLDPAIWENRLGVRDVVFERSLTARLKYSFLSMAGSLVRWWQGRRRSSEELYGKRWLVVVSTNEEESVNFLTRNDRYRLVPFNTYSPRNSSVSLNWFPKPKLWYLARYLPFIYAVSRQSPEHFTRTFHMLVHGVGCLENAQATLKKYRPELVVLSNDHVPPMRAIAVAARKAGIPTVYIQHASVGTDFPRLIYDLSLLDGQEALNRYTDQGLECAGRIALVGSAKYDAFVGYVNQSTTVRAIGIPYGFFDDPEQVMLTARRLREAFPDVKVSLRPHPRDLRPRPPSDPELKLEWSDSTQENVMVFLAHQDVILATTSGVHLEAALLNVTSLYCPFLSCSGKTNDSYGFLASGLADPVSSPEELLTIIKGLKAHRPPVRHRADHFVSGLDDKSTGGTLDHIEREIEHLLETMPPGRGHPNPTD